MSCQLFFVSILTCLTFPQTLSTNTWAVEELSRSNADFALKLYDTVRSKVGTDENIFMSPISISTAFAMLFAGARGNTKDELQKAFFEDFNGGDGAVHQGFSDLMDAFNDRNNNYTLKMANRVFGRVEYNFNDEYLQDTEEFYQATIARMNFTGDAEGSRQEINDWVAEQTMQKIKDLLPKGSVNAMTAMVLVNAIYFKGDWVIPFRPRDTEPQPFHLTPSSEIQVEMMNNKGVYSYSHVDELGCRVLELPYAGDEVSMYVFIPNEIDGLATLEKKININNFMEALNPDAYLSEKCKVRLPKFNMTFTLSLKDVLKEIGVRDLFVPLDADLSGINGKRDLFVSDAAHKAFVDVNEKGTEAAAGTGIMVGTAMEEVPPPELFADRPFLFVIKEKTTGAVLFMGSYTKPPGENPIVGAFGLRGLNSGTASQLNCGLGLLVMTACVALTTALFSY